MKIFVAGATGVLGKRVVPELTAMGNEVVGLSRSKEDGEIIREQGAEPRRGSLFDAGGLIDISSDCDAMINLAVAIPTKSRTRINDWVLKDRVRVEGTANLIAAARHNSCNLYIQESVTFLYGRKHGEWVDEACSPSNDLPPMVKSCVDMERQVLTAVTRNDLPALILRFGNIYSCDFHYTAEMYRLISLGKYPLIEKGNVYWDVVHADDAAGAVIAAVKNSKENIGKVFNICDDEPVLYRNLVTYVSELLKAPKPIGIPVFLAKLAMGRRTVEYLLQSARCSNKRAKDELGWILRYPTYREGHAVEAARWLKGQEHIPARPQAALGV